MKKQICLLLFLFIITCVSMAQESGQAQQDSPVAVIDSTYYVTLVNRAFHEILELNKNRFAYIDSVKAGDIVLLPNDSIYVVKEFDGIFRDCVWQAAPYYVKKYKISELFQNFTPYVVVSDSAKSDSILVVASNTSDTFSWWPYVVILFFILFVAISAATIKRKKKKQEKLDQETVVKTPGDVNGKQDDNQAVVITAESENEENPPFVKDPPVFGTVTPREITSLAQKSLTRAYGPGTKLIGEAVKGRLQDDFLIFNSDGSHRVVCFREEPGFRQRVRKPDGQEIETYSIYSCFNIAFSPAKTSNPGYFTPSNGDAEFVSIIEGEEIEQISATIIETAQETQELAVTADNVLATDGLLQDDGRLRITELRISPQQGITLRGENIPMTIDELSALTKMVLKPSSEKE